MTTARDIPALLTRLRDEADLCRNETAVDVANLLDEAAGALEDQARSLTAAERHTAEAVYQERMACYEIANKVGDKKEGHSLGYRSAGWEIAELIKGRGTHGA